MSSGTNDPLNMIQTVHFGGEERVDIIYRPHDRYTEIAEHVVSQWEKYLKIRGVIHGELAYSDELQMLIAEELRKEKDDTEKIISEKTGGS